MIQSLAKNAIIYPTHYLRRENIGAHLSEVHAINRSGHSEIERFQQLRLCDVARAAMTGANPLADTLRRSRRHITSNSIKNLIAELPLQSKEMMRSALKECGKPKGIAVDYRTTSGSTGFPLQFYKDRLATGYMDAVLYSAYSWHSIRVGDPQARFWGMPLMHKAALMARLKDLLKNRIRFSAFDLSDTAKDNYYRRLHAFRPTYFYGYPSLIAEFCNFAGNSKKELGSLSLKAVIGTGEYVYPHERDIIEQATEAPFVNEYGCTEVGLIGFECEQRSLHVMASNIYLEVIKDGKNVVDEEGEIYVTELHAASNPFIRYGLGDRGVLCSERCSCGRALPVLRIMSGRKDDYVLTPQGNKIYDAIFAYVLKEGVDKFKAVQKSIDLIEISVVVNAGYSDSIQNNYLETLQKHFGDAMKIVFSVVDSIPHEKSGKLRYFERTF